MCDCQNKNFAMEDNADSPGFQWGDLGDFADTALNSIGLNFSATAQDNQSRAQYNAAVAKLVNAKAEATKTQSREVAKAANNLVIGLLVILGIYVFAKFVLPKLKF